jgi:hypothetical protein
MFYEVFKSHFICLQIKKKIQEIESGKNHVHFLRGCKQGRETAKAFPLYTIAFRSHCIQWERFCRFSSLVVKGL